MASVVHLVMVAGVVVTAVGGELVIAHPLAHTPAAVVAVLVGGSAWIHQRTQDAMGN